MKRRSGTSKTGKALSYLSGLEAGARRAVIMAIDVIMVLVTIPIALALSMSELSFDALSPLGIAVWAFVVLVSHLIFRLNGLYNTVWRFASTPDFFNIITSCALVTVVLYVIAISFRAYTPVTGLNERQFIVFFLVAFAFISAPRLIYRYVREGSSWSTLTRARHASGKRAIFIGHLDEADVIIRFSHGSVPGDTAIIGLMTIENDVPLSTRLRGVPVIANQSRLSAVLEDYVTGTNSVDLVIFGQGAERDLPNFAELVRIARLGGVEVVQFSGFSKLKRGGKLVLESVEMETILRRPTVQTDIERIGRFLRGKRVLVTGGAGSIGRTLVWRALQFQADAVLVADISEFGIFRLREFIEEKDRDRLTCRIVDVGDKLQFARVVREFRPDVIFHAAALKHVPLLEENWSSAIKANVFGTLTCAEVAADCGVTQFVLISSDKAADPSSVLGLTKRVAEQIVNALHGHRRPAAKPRQLETDFAAVRFGNVFGSDGSVATVFEKQIRSGGPVTITDRAMTRYMMTIAEAVDLVIMTAAHSAEGRRRNGYGTYMLDMGEPVSILTVAETMIRLAGKKPHVDIPIEFAGIRPGEKLHEALCASGEEIVGIDLKSVFGLKTGTFEWHEIKAALNEIQSAVFDDDKARAVEIMSRLFRPLTEILPAPAPEGTSAAQDLARPDPERQFGIRA